MDISIQEVSIPSDGVPAVPQIEKPDGPVIVGIGASAGGLEALQAFVRNLKPDGRFSYVVAQHLSPHHRSMLLELLARETTLEVKEVTKAVAPRANIIYITPPNKHIEYHDGHLIVRTPKVKAGPQPSIDVFFASLALELETHTIGIIFSGTGSDGARGIQAIKAAGGVTCAHDDSAKYDGMPRAAISTGSIDYVMSPAEIGERLPEMLEQSVNEPLLDAKRLPPDAYETIVSVVRSHTKIDFSDYRHSTILRRVSRRMRAKQIGALDEYAAFLEQNGQETHELAAELLIGVTSFFRDRESFAELAKVIERIIRTKSEREQVRVWVPACSSGEEAYSVAILLLETYRRAGILPRFQVFATDLDETALMTARKGLYSAAMVEPVEPAILSRYFKANGLDFLVDTEVRDFIVFSRHNVIEDPPFSKLDLISCRNLFIYFNSILQRRVLERFHYALRQGGCLFLGKSETIGERQDLFNPVIQSARIYRAATNVDTSYRPVPPASGLQTTILPQRRPDLNRWKRDAGCHEAIVKSFGPPCVVVGQDGRPMFFSGNTAPYLRIPDGASKLDIFNLVRNDVRPELRAMITHSRRENTVVRSRAHTVEHEGDRWSYRVEVHPQRDRESDEELSIVGFIPVRPLVERQEDEAEDAVELESSSEQIEVLEHELATMREHLQTMVEELETSNEELQALNEEMQSSNEELQSTNEELETSNEELQSTNEELTTVNEEMAVKTQELYEANVFLASILDSIANPVLVTDTDGRLLQFNRSVNAIFEIDESDKGKPIGVLRKTCRLPDISAMIETALDTGRSRSRRVNAGKQRYQLHVHACREKGQRVIGAVVIFDDITKLAESNDKLRDREREMMVLSTTQAAILDSLPAHVALLDGEGRILAVNGGWRQFASENDYDGEAFAVGDNYLQVCHGVEGDAARDANLVLDGLMAVLSGKQDFMEVRYTCDSPTDKRWFRCIARAVRSDEMRFGAVVMHINETEQVLAEQSMIESRKIAEDASTAKSRFLAHMSHELRTPLNAIIGFSEIQMREFFGAQSHPKYAEYAADVHSEAKSLLSMIDEILDLSKVEAGQHDLQEVRVDLALCLASVVKLVIRIADERSITIEQDIAEDFPGLLADEGLVRRMLTNLLSNALKFTEPKGFVRVSAEVTDDEHLVLIVSDTGIGIAAEKMKRILEPFSQVDSTLTSSQSGVGLGLALVNSMIKAHGGTLDIDSELGVGTSVTLCFPPSRLIRSSFGETESA